MTDWFDELQLDPAAHPVAMGVHALGEREWLVADEDFETDLAIKRGLLRDKRAQVLHVTEQSRDAAELLSGLVGAAATNTGEHGIERAALAVQEDLCLLQRRDDGWHLDASCLCFPTRWHLHEKVGQHIAAVHAPVDGYDPRITDRVDRLFDQLTDRPVWRRNWFLMTDTTLYQPDRPEYETIIAADRVLHDLYVRSERQTLREITPGWIVFTIRIQHQSLAQLLTSPERRADFVTWTQHVSDDFGRRRHLTTAQRTEILAALDEPPKKRAPGGSRWLLGLSAMADAHSPDTLAWRYTAELAQDIELRWQANWDENKTFETPNPAGPLADPEALAGRGAKLFVLDMFPYPSGSGLHVGHPLGFIGTDVYSRFQRMQGRNVLYSMGFDAFGLPAEQFAVETGQHPAITTDANITNYRRQLHRFGLSHDRRRSISTTDPEYYKWTQWIFRTIFESWYDDDQDKARPIAELVAEFESGDRAVDGDHAGNAWSDLSANERAQVIDGHRLAYVAHAPVNWCPGLGTVVANEEVTSDNRSDRGNFPVFKRNMRQWMMRITKYADRLADDLDLLDWTDAIKTMQRNWIGRSDGATVHFASAAGQITVFTTRPDTLFGATFMVLSPEHPLVDELTTADQADAVAAYREAAAAKTDIDRQDDTREKTGVPTGSTATNPVTGQEVPVWIADYVLMGYGTGAIMAVPCGDQRDFEFARKFGLPIPAIQNPPAEWFDEHNIEASLDTSTWPVAYVGDAPYVQSANDSLDLNGTADVASGVAATNEWLDANGHGTATVNYKLRDWLFSRQRYWGEPFPVVYDQDGNPHTLPEELLPVLLPETDSFEPRTFDPDDADTNPESPLDRLDDWVNVELDLGDGPQMYRRDTNVMPQWAGSCWYEMRYLDPTNSERFVGREVEEYWMGPRTDERPDHPGGVDLYVGGVEHAVLHLLYARFWHKVLFDLGHVSSREPYARLYNQGYVMEDAFKDERGIYVDAFKVDRNDDGTFTLLGEQVSKETGKMGKSKKNAVSPDEMYGAYGADTLRLHLMAMGPLDQSRPWNIDDVVGMYRFLQRVWRNIVDEDSGVLIASDAPADEATTRALHKTIDAVTTEMTHLRFNTAIAKLVELNNEVTKLDTAPRDVMQAMVQMLAPLAPHICEELWQRMGHDQSLTYEPFPVADPALLVDDQVEYPVQVNGKVRARITVAADADNDTIEAAALAEENVARTLDGNDPKKVIVVPGRMVNIVA